MILLFLVYAPYSTLQTVNLQTLLSILGSTKSTDIPAIVRALPADAQDTLMKYLYKGMGVSGWGDVSGSVLLGWHEKVRFNFYFYCDCNWVVSCVAPLYLLQFRLMLTMKSFFVQLTEVAGTGCIVRVMTDRRAV